MIIVSTVSLLLTLLVGHENLFAALYGWRIYFFYFSFIFIMGKVLNREDILKMGRFCMYVSIPMTILIMLQFYSPQSAWVNRGVGGDMEGAGFFGALGYFRPSGTFSFISGFTYFQLLVSFYLLFYMFSNDLLEKKERINGWLLLIIGICYLVTIPFSISRTHFFQTVVVVVFAIVGALFSNKAKKVLKIVVSSVIVFMCFVSYNIKSDGVDAFLHRFDSASNSEGGLEGSLGDRYIGSITRAFDTGDAFWGYGLGFGSNVGAKMLGLENMYTKFNSDQEWVRVFGESGLILGFLIMLIRVCFSFSVSINSFKKLKKQEDLLPWLFSCGVLMVLMMGQLNANSSLGFAVFIGGLCLASLKSYKV
ncbi:hypothetical protein Q4595_15300 [Wenyingzhuangia sp. 1_MG-2023]|nr:hypothetical protein [Wenyingzhuangia sp. 1_MG-2023]